MILCLPRLKVSLPGLLRVNFCFLPYVLLAMAGGVVLSLGNLSTQYAWAFVGLSVAEVITASITVVSLENQLVLTSNSTNPSLHSSEKPQALSSDGYYRRRKNQLIRTSEEDSAKQARLKQAKEEAEKEIAEFHAQMDAEFHRKVAEVKFQEQ